MPADTKRACPTAAAHAAAGSTARATPRGRRGRVVTGLLLAVAALTACAADTAPDSAPPVSTRTSVTTTAPVTTLPAPVTTTSAAPRRFRLAASGDVLVHAPVIRSAANYAGGVGYDFAPMFDGVRDELTAADLTLCHLESPVSPDNTRLTVSGTLSFNAPRELTTALVGAGFDGCDTAGNHMWDRGRSGMLATLDVLAEAGLRNAGMSRDAIDAANPPIYDVRGVKVGHLAFSYTILNMGGPNDTVPADAPWLEAVLWPRIGAEGVLAQARALRARGADFVVVSVHWGAQYVRTPTADQRELARALLTSPDVDLILGDHVHVVQPCERIDGKYVIYGMGNFLSNQSPTQDASLRLDNQDGVIVHFEVVETSPGVFTTVGMRYTPTWVVLPGHRIEKATPDQHAASYARTLDAMGSLGAGACDATPTS